MNSNRNAALIVIRVVVWIFLVGAALISFSHIVHVSQLLGLGWESWTVPAFVDGIAIVGKVSMLPRFSDAFRRSGFRLLMFGGILSLAANVAAGDNWGERAFGVLVVAGFMILESHATKATRTAVAKAETVDPALAERRKAAAAKGAATRKANFAKAQQDDAEALAAAQAKKDARNAAARQRRAVQAVMPVSPPPAGPMAPSIHIPTPDEVAALVA